MSAKEQAKVARRYRQGVAKRLDRIEAGVASLNDAVAVLLAERAATVGANERVDMDHEAGR